MIPNPNKIKMVSLCLVLLVALIAGCNSQKAETSVSTPPAVNGTSAPSAGSTTPPVPPTKPLVEGNALESQRRSNAAAYADYMAKQQAGNRP